jgi:hypothetical protein
MRARHARSGIPWPARLEQQQPHVAAPAGASLASTIQQNTRWSQSSPPSAASPLVEITSNTPFESLRIEMSKVPPPRSNTA